MTQQLLINEWVALVPGESLVLSESTVDGAKVYVAEGIFGWCDRPTANGRVYPRHLIEREIKRLQPLIEARRVAGELEHPEDGRTDLNRVSHRITHLEVRLDGSVFGRLEVMGTPNGIKLENIIDSGLVVGVSSRALGSVREDRASGNQIVQDDLKLLTYDVVADPAVGNAIPEFSHKSTPAAVATENIASPEEPPMPMSLEELKKNHPELFEAIHREARASLSSSVEEKLKQQEARYASNLEKVLSKMQESSRPAPAPDGVEKTLEQIKTAIGPHLNLDEARADEFRSLQSRIQALEEERADMRLQVAESEQRLRAALIGRELSMVLPSVESSQREKFLRLLGPMEHFESVEQFRSRVETLADDFKERGLYVEDVDRAMLALAEADRVAEKYKAQVESRDSVLKRSVEAMGRLRDDNKALAERIVARDSALAEAKAMLESMASDIETRNSILESARLELMELSEERESMSAAMEEARAELESRRVAIKKLTQRAAALEESKREVELDLYRHKSAVGHRSPNKLVHSLREAQDPAGVDSLLAEMNSPNTMKNSFMENVRGGAAPSNERLDGILSERVMGKIYGLAQATPSAASQQLNLASQVANTRVSSVHLSEGLASMMDGDGAFDDEDAVFTDLDESVAIPGLSADRVLGLMKQA